MSVKKLTYAISTGVLALVAGPVLAADGYGPFPITEKSYQGDKTNSVSYSGQVARHVLHNSLKKAISSGASIDVMNQYWKGAEGELLALDPKSKEGFPVADSDINKISSGKNLNEKTYKARVAGFPGDFTGPELVEFWLQKASESDKGYDAKSGMDYTQLVSKYLMGAVFYNQACDNYLDEKLNANKNPNDKPYKEGAYYTGKEHVWDEAFGYFGAPAHTLSLTAEQAYNIAKGKGLDVADANGSGAVDLKTEMTFAHAYYAADSDKSGQSDYLHTITQAFIDGRKVISDADGKALSDAERSAIKGYAETICSNWESVIVEATFKYAGSVYKDIEKLNIILESKGDAADAYRTYVKHYGELKGFALALQSGANNLGPVADDINNLTGFGPVTLDGQQISGLSSNGNYSFTIKEFDAFAVHMLKLQKLLDSNFVLKAKKNNMLAEFDKVAAALGDSGYAEND